jgi:outer membrane protein assembly factor BamB
MESPASGKPDPPPATLLSKLRRWLLPVIVLAAVVAWRLPKLLATRYFTFLDVIALIVAALIVSGWYLECSTRSRRGRWTVVAGSWLLMAASLLVFRPVFNGDMGIYGWRLRFAAAADQQLGEIVGDQEAVDFKTTPNDYPRFLGTGYWPEVSGAELAADWSANPPEEVWRREIGAGWSAFAIVGNYAFTQEQRGDQELVTCYRVDSGVPVWFHGDTTRFDPADFQGGLGGIGPRATPTIHDGNVLTQGATGIVNCLDARTGNVRWSHDTAQEFAADVVVWGKSGSPLVVDGLVVVNVGAPNDPATRGDYDSSLVAFDLESGSVRWAAGNRQASYASPVVATLAGERQIVVVNEGVVTSHRTADGLVLWEYPWAHAQDTNASASQPIPLPGDRLLLTKGYGVGASLLQVAQSDAGKWSVQPLWNPPIKRLMKTKFTNSALRDGFVYGLDDVLLECMELETGAVQWKKRRQPTFGYGQVLLVGGTLLVLTESGELLMVEAMPDEYRELGSLQALDSANVTWNTLAFAPPFLLVRNSREVACYRLPLAEDEPQLQ